METERLILRPLAVSDAETVFTNWISDPDVAEFMRWELHKSVFETQEWLASEEKLFESEYYEEVYLSWNRERIFESKEYLLVTA